MVLVKREDITDEQVVAACRAAHADNIKSRSLDILMETTGAPKKVALAAMYRACGNGLIDWGVTIELAWTTEDKPVRHSWETLTRMAVEIEEGTR